MNDLVNLDLVAGTNISLDKVGTEVSVNCTYEYDDTNLASRITDLEDGMINYALVTESGNKLVISLNSSTYTMSIGLYDKNNTLISTSNEIDLPIETLIVSITYDSSTNELVITYKSGSVVRVPIGAIITGVEMQSNKTTVINSSSTDTQYPSAKAVYNTFVKPTDYATESKTGVIKLDNSYATKVSSSSGNLYCDTKTYEFYTTANNSMFIGKGTLENVLANRLGPIDDVLDAINGEVI